MVRQERLFVRHTKLSDFFPLFLSDELDKAPIASPSKINNFPFVLLITTDDFVVNDSNEFLSEGVVDQVKIILHFYEFPQIVFQDVAGSIWTHRDFVKFVVIGMADLVGM